MKFLKLIIVLTVSLFAEELVTGIIKPIYDGKLSVATDGILEKLYFKEGDIVKKNQVILKLDDKLQKLETQRRKLVLNDKTQQVSLRANLKIMKTIIKQKEYFYKTTKAISLNEVRQLRMQYIKNKGELASLIENKKKEKVEYKIALNVLKYYRLLSPVEGIIIKIDASLGEWVQTGKVIVEVMNIDRCFVEVDLSQDLLKRLEKDLKVKVEVEVKGKTVVKIGIIEFISTIADSSSSLVRAKVFFDNRDRAVIPGLSAHIIF